MAAENILNISLKEYKKQIEELKGSLLGLEKTSDEYKSKLSQVQSMQGRLNSVLSDCKATNSAVQGSYNALVSELANLRKEWKSTADEVERSQIGEKMLAINNQLKELDASVGNYQRNVGDYANQFQSAFSALGGSIEGTFASLKTLTSSLPELGKAISSVAGKMKAMYEENPYLLAIAIAITAIVGVAKKFKDVVSENSDLQKRWNANMAAFQPILDYLNKAFTKGAEIIMDVVDWCVDHLPTFFKTASMWIQGLLTQWQLILNAITFFPTIIGQAFGKAVELVGKGAKKIGEGMSSVLEFFGMDEAAEKVKKKMTEIGQTVSDFGADVSSRMGGIRNAINDTFNGWKEKVDGFLTNLGEMAVASKNNVKEQQKVAKEEKALAVKSAAVQKEVTEKRIALKKAETKEEKARLRQEIIAMNESIAAEKKALAQKKLLLKQEQYTRNGRVMTKEERAELQELKIAAARAGSEELQRNLKMTESSSTTSAAVKAATKAANDVSSAFIETFKKVMQSVKEDALATSFNDMITKLLKGSRIRELAAKNINDYLKADDGSIKRALEGTSGQIEQSLRLMVGEVLNKNGDYVTQDLLDTVFDNLLKKTKYGAGAYDISGFMKEFGKYLKDTLNYTSDEIEAISKEEFAYFYKDCKEKVSTFNENLPKMMLERALSIDFSTTDIERKIMDYKNLLSKVGEELEKAHKEFAEKTENEDAAGVENARNLITLLTHKKTDIEQSLIAANSELETQKETITALAAVKRNVSAIAEASEEINTILKQAEKGDYEGIYNKLTEINQINITKKVKQNGKETEVVKQFSELTKDELEAVKQVFEKQGQAFLLNYYSALLQSIGTNASALDKAITDNISSRLSIITKNTEDSLKRAYQRVLSTLNEEDTTAFENTIFDDSWWKSRSNKIQEYQDLIEENKDNAEYAKYNETVKAYSEQINALSALKAEMIEVGATAQEMDAINASIAEAEANRQNTLSELHTFLSNKTLKEEQKVMKQNQKVVNYSTRAMSNIGDALTTLASIRQESINQQLENGQITEEEAEKQWESTKKVAIAAATIQTLGTAIGETYSIWTDTSITSFWAKAALVASTVPATVASLVAQIQQIKSTSPSSSSSISSSGSTTASVSSVSVTPILDENQDMNTIQQIKAGNTSEAINNQRVYILESDIQKSNKRVSVREKHTTF